MAGLYPGSVFSFVHPKEQYSMDYLVMSMEHSLMQQAATEHENDIGNLAYTLHAYIIPRAVAFRPELKPLQPLPTFFGAKIESNGPYPQLD